MLNSRWSCAGAVLGLAAWSVSASNQPRPQPAVGAFTVEGAPVRVHALPTGTVQIKACHARNCLWESAGYVPRFLLILLDRSFAQPMPIWTYAIEHPEGVFVVDAGATPAYNDDESWSPDPVSRRLVRSFIRLDVTQEEALPSRLVALGLAPSALVLTHQHVDHTAAVPAFPGVPVWTTRAEDRAASDIGALHWRWRSADTLMRYVDEEGEPSETGLGASVFLTEDRSIEVIHTPGHTPGSTTVRLRTDQGEIWFTGDTSFTEEGMDPHAPAAGIHTDMAAVRVLHAALPGRGMLLPAHDPGVPARLGGAR